MAIFFLIALKDSTTTVDDAVQNAYPNSSFQIEPGKWAISAKDVAIGKELAEKLGIRTTSSHLIIPAIAYSGRAQPSLWEWLNAQAELSANVG